MVLTTYGRSSGFCIDPIEKKPLNHFYPGSLGALVRHRRLQPRLQVLPELGHLEVARDGHADGRGHAGSDRGRGRADCVPSVAFTYNDPVIFAEYAMDVADACHALGIKTVAVTAGYIGVGCAARVLREDGRRERRPQGVHRRVLLEALRRAARSRCWTRWSICEHETDVWFEITTLLIPGKNDSDAETEAMCRWIVARARPRRAAALHGVPSRLQDDGHRRARRPRR